MGIISPKGKHGRVLIIVLQENRYIFPLAIIEYLAKGLISKSYPA
jgi:hypothetical protein